MYMCKASIPEGIYTHGDAAVSLTSTMGVVRVYTPLQVMNRSQDLPYSAITNSVLVVDQDTKDININPDSPASSQSVGDEAEGFDDNNPDNLGHGDDHRRDEE